MSKPTSNTDIESKVDQAVKQLFEKYDADRSGQLEGQEVAKIIQDVFLHLRESRQIRDEDVKKVMNALDKNNDGKVSTSELKEMILRCMNKK